jgi:NAD+ synthase
MKITLAQLNFTVGDFAGNTAKIIATVEKFKNSDLIIFPELCVSGYPPEDLVLRSEFIKTSLTYTQKIIDISKKFKCDILINTPWKEDENLYNAAIIISKGKIIHKQYKFDLPNYGVFDEKRVFKAGPKPKPFKYKKHNIGLLICEDTWNESAAKSLKGSEFIISVNASPYERTKHRKRLRILKTAAKASMAPIFYLNQVTGHDDLVFDGGSQIVNSEGQTLYQMNFFEEDVKTFDTAKIFKTKPLKSNKIDETEHIYRAMMFGLKEYVEKNHFKGVIIGLSGGIDSAITASTAADSLGKDKVKLVFLPSKYTSKESLEDATKLSKNLGINLDEIDIQPLVDIIKLTLAPFFKGKKEDITEENIQSRIRGLLLMAISNKMGHLVITTGNKSEIATGYCTLYGDMCGGYNVIKDLYKTKVFEVSNWRNENIPSDAKIRKTKIIPKRIIEKAPSAELRPDQKDEDSLPPYQTLDKILYNLIEKQYSAEEIIAEGFDKHTVNEVEKMLYKSEHNRRQSAIGIKISSKPFGRDRRYPITNKFLEY